MSFEVKYTDENNYIISVFTGILNFPDIYSSWDNLIKEKLTKHEYIGVIYDFSYAQLDVKINDLSQLMALFKKNNKVFDKLKIAVIVTSPDNIIFPTIAQLNSPFNIKAFSTIDAAKKWILRGRLNQQ